MIKYKVYSKNNYFCLESIAPQEFFTAPSKNVEIDISNTGANSYKIFNLRDWDSKVPLQLSQLLKEDGSPYSLAEWELFYSESTGNFNGGGTAPVETDPIFLASEANLFTAGDKNNLDNQSGINTGDETTLTIQTKRPLKTVNNTSLEGSGNVQINYNDLSNLPTLVTNHSALNLNDGTNPHGTTKTDVGLGNVDNTSDLNKPISIATQIAINPLHQTTLLTLDGVIEINPSNNMLYDFPSGTAVIYKNGMPTFVSWGAISARSTPYLGVSPNTFIAIDTNGALVETQDLQSVTQMGDVIPIGFLEHTGGTIIERVGTEPQYNINLGTQWQQFLETFGSFVVEGFDVNVSTLNNLGLNVAAGTVFDNGLGFTQNIKAPNHYSQVSVNDTEIHYYHRDGLGGWVNNLTNVTSIDPNKYDDGSGVLQNIPAGKFSIQRITYYPQFGYLDLYYDQIFYNTIDEAIAGYYTDAFEENPYLSFNSKIAILVVKQGTTDLNNILDAVIRKTSENSIGGNTGGGGGESNTASNVGTLGVGVFDTKVGVDLRFKNIAPNSNKVSIAEDINKNINVDVLPNLSVSPTTLILQQTTPGTGGVANATTFGDPANTNISVIVPAIPIGATLVSTQVYITYQSNDPSYTNELFTRITLPNLSQLTDLQAVGIGSFPGIIFNQLLLTSNTISPVGNWLFEFRESFNDVGIDANISEIKIVVNYSISKELFNFDGKLQAHQFVGDGSLLTNLPSNLSMAKAVLLTTQASTSNTINSVLSNHSFTIPPGKSLTLTGILIFVSAATTTGAFYGIQVIQPISAAGNVIGSFSSDVRLSSTASATNLTDGDIINVAPNATTNFGILGTATTAGNNSATVIANIKNMSLTHSTIVNVIFRSEVNGSTITAQIGSSAIGLIG